MSLTNPFEFILISTITLLIGFLPGYLLLSIFSSLKGDEKVVASFGVSFLLIFIFSFIAFVFDFEQRATNLSGLLVVTIALVLLAIVRKSIVRTGGIEAKLLLLVFIGFYIHAISSQAITPIYTGGFFYADWYTHYASSLFYLNNGDIAATGSAAQYLSGYLPIKRTPLFNIIAGYFMSIFGDSFWVYQIASALMSVPMLLSAYLLAKKLFNEKIALITIGFFFFNPLILREIVYTWQKPLATYMILLSLYFYLKIRSEKHSMGDIFFCGLFAGLAGLAHQFTYIYLAGIVLDYLLVVRNRNLLPSRTYMLIFFIPLFSVLLPYYAWGAHTYGLSTTVLANPSILKSYGLLESILIGFQNLTLNIIPLELGYYSVRSILEWHMFQVKLLDSILSYYYNTLEGAITTTVALMLIIKFRKNIVTSIISFKNNRQTLILFAGVGYAGSSMSMIYPQNHGVISNIGLPVMLLLLIYAASLFTGLSAKLKKMVLAGVFIEFMLIEWVQLIFLYTGLREISTEGNYLLKVKYGVIYAWDYLGDAWIYFIIPVLLIEGLFLLFAYRTFVKDRIHFLA